MDEHKKLIQSRFQMFSHKNDREITSKFVGCQQTHINISLFKFTYSVRQEGTSRHPGLIIIIHLKNKNYRIMVHITGALVWLIKGERLFPSTFLLVVRSVSTSKNTLQCHNFDMFHRRRSSYSELFPESKHRKMRPILLLSNASSRTLSTAASNAP